ncbi:pentapeptide repeat-containing protein [Plantactinospora sp. WMMB782]|uniref:pentapeptide repeat-containing protein n=1 Tax=Plantactinospora sp. WMMB782 TaxID=3404121 RepID=UPI003B92C176
MRTDQVGTDLVGTDLVGTDLVGTDLVGTDLVGTGLSAPGCSPVRSCRHQAGRRDIASAGWPAPPTCPDAIPGCAGPGSPHLSRCSARCSPP